MQKPLASLDGDQPVARFFWRRILIVIFSLVLAPPARADGTNLAGEVRLLREQNALLQQQVKQQGEQIRALSEQFHELQSSAPADDDRPSPPANRFSLGQVHLGAEGGVGYADTGPEGFAPDGKFRVDEARLSLESPIWDDVYFYGEIYLATQEMSDMDAKMGELYVEFENLSKLWRQDNQLNARLGQMDIPFGEEYLTRHAIDDPLITHSIVDYWGATPGIELYGNAGKFSYVIAAQNGAGDGNGAGGDKAVAGRIGFDPDEHWHFSASGMRTGDLRADQLSAVWFGSGFFRSIGSADTTRFHVEAAELDATARWRSGHVGVLGGWARYHDNDSGGGNTRNIYYYSAEAVQNLPGKFYAATRWSQVLCRDGIPVVGYGNFGDFLYGPLTTDLWRLSLGLGYRFSDQLVLKLEYSFEGGEELGGGSRQHENFLGTEAAFKF